MRMMPSLAMLGSVVIAVGLLASAWSKDLTIDNLTFLPKPNPITSTPSNYELDEEATVNYYNKLFHGRSAADVIDFFESNGIPVTYNSKYEISIIVEKQIMIFYYYTVSVSLKFENGVFDKSSINYYGII
ncbi:hypothetical protein [Martelella mangrovi]|uniref:DUF4783 domain-containing protein n=1 Tax=Martelella mangrovi TaxID=1397477 RepID=A0ABV2IG43_9HYPH